MSERLVISVNDWQMSVELKPFDTCYTHIRALICSMVESQLDFAEIVNDVHVQVKVYR